MSLEIKSFAEPGNLQKERLVLRAIDNVELGRFLVLRSKKSTSGGPISGAKDAYWFPDIEIAAGDLVVLYTRSGKASKKELAGGATAHFYYWHKKTPFWGEDKENTAVLLETRDWAHRSPK